MARATTTVCGIMVVCSGLGACSGGGDGSNNDNGQSSGTTADAGMEPDAGPPPGWQLGTGDHTATSVTLTQIASAADGLRVPRDLAFHNTRADELWVVNRADDSTVTITNASQSTRTALKRVDGYALHFMEEVSSLAFGKPDQFATCQESRNTYNNQGPPNDFMGPALWSADTAIYAVENPIGLGSHLDMLHESPLCMGIAHVVDNVFWTFDGMTGSLSFYDFQEDHGAGYDDHSDGVIYRYADGQLQRVPDVPSHLAYDLEGHMLYVADSGNHRLGRMDVTVGAPGPRLPSKEPGVIYQRYLDAVVEDVVAAPTSLLDTPSGLELYQDMLWVTDNANGRISVFAKDGTRLNWLDTGLQPGALMGLTFGPDGRIYFVDAVDNRVLRVDP